MKRTPAIARGSGFTLIELMVSMALLSIFGLLVVRFLDTSLGLWREGEATRDVLEQRLALGSTLERDLSSIAAGPERLLFSTVRAGHPALDFVRLMPPGEELRVLDDLRYRGLLPGAIADLIANRERAYDEALRAWNAGGGTVGGAPERFQWVDAVPSRGAARVIYEITRDPLHRDPGILALYRAVLPVGLGLHTERADLLKDLAEPGADERGLFRKVAGSLLYLDWNFRSEWTRSWEDPPVDFDDWSRALAEFKTAAVRRTAGLEVRAPIIGWDSSRGDLDPLNDVYPEALRLTAVLLGREERERPWTLAEGLLPTSSRGGRERPQDVELEGAMRALPRAAEYAKIGAEWVEVTAVSSRTITVRKRGLRGTAAAEHAAGTRVYFGHELSLFLSVPVSYGGLTR